MHVVLVEDHNALLSYNNLAAHHQSQQTEKCLLHHYSIVYCLYLRVEDKAIVMGQVAIDTNLTGRRSDLKPTDIAE